MMIEALAAVRCSECHEVIGNALEEWDSTHVHLEKCDCPSWNDAQVVGTLAYIDSKSSIYVWEVAHGSN